MHIIEVSSGIMHEIVVEPVTANDLKKITKKRYSFNRKAEKGYSVYKLRANGQSDILGLISLENIDSESRIEVRLLAVSAENVGRYKLFERIAGNLFAFACRIALKNYGAKAAISLVPKTSLGQHYMDKYGFEQAGRSLFIAGKELINLLNEYDHE